MGPEGDRQLVTPKPLKRSGTDSNFFQVLLFSFFNCHFEGAAGRYRNAMIAIGRLLA